MRTALGRGLRRVAVFVVAFCAALGTLFAAYPLMPNTNFDQHVSSPPSRVERLVTEHDCWTHGPAPVKVPHHAVISRLGRQAQYVGQHGTDQALHQIFDGEEHGLIIHAFCR